MSEAFFLMASVRIRFTSLTTGASSVARSRELRSTSASSPTTSKSSSSERSFITSASEALWS